MTNKVEVSIGGLSTRVIIRNCRPYLSFHAFYERPYIPNDCGKIKSFKNRCRDRSFSKALYRALLKQPDGRLTLEQGDVVK